MAHMYILGGVPALLFIFVLWLGVRAYRQVNRDRLEKQRRREKQACYQDFLEVFFRRHRGDNSAEVLQEYDRAYRALLLYASPLFFWSVEAYEEYRNVKGGSVFDKDMYYHKVQYVLDAIRKDMEIAGTVEVNGDYRFCCWTAADSADPSGA